MPKKIKFESFKNQLLINAYNESFIEDKNKWKALILNLNFVYEGKEFIISSKNNKDINLRYNINDAKFYTRGDLDSIANSPEDNVKNHNKDFFSSIVKILATKAKLV
jgi:hypothetical protein